MTLALCRVLPFEHLSWEVKGAGGSRRKSSSAATLVAQTDSGPLVSGGLLRRLDGVPTEH